MRILEKSTIDGHEYIITDSSCTLSYKGNKYKVMVDLVRGKRGLGSKDDKELNLALDITRGHIKDVIDQLNEI